MKCVFFMHLYHRITFADLLWKCNLSIVHIISIVSSLPRLQITNLEHVEVHVARKIMVVPRVLERGPWLMGVYKTRILLMLDCPSVWLYESALWRTRMLLPDTGRKVAYWLLLGFIQCGYLHILIIWSLVRGRWVRRWRNVCIKITFYG